MWFWTRFLSAEQIPVWNDPVHGGDSAGGHIECERRVILLQGQYLRAALCQGLDQSADHIALRVADLDDECIKAPLTPRLKDHRRRL